MPFAEIASLINGRQTRAFFVFELIKRKKAFKSTFEKFTSKQKKKKSLKSTLEKFTSKQKKISNTSK